MPTRRLPRSITELLASFRPCFTAPTFEVFCALAVGFWAQPGAHTVTGMLMAAGLSATWHHARAHRFFSQARWQADQLGLCLLDLIVALLVPAGAPVRLVVDDTLFRRSGRKVFAAAWHHDPLGVGRNAIAWGNNWVVVGVLVDLPFLPYRPVCLPILARLWWPGHTPGRLELAVELVTVICGHLGPRRVDLICDGAYAGKALRQLPRQVTVTTRLRADAALYQLPPPRRPGQRGRPPAKGARLPELTRLAGMTSTPFALHRATLYSKPRTLAVAHFTCLWPSVFSPRPVHVTLIRAPTAPDGFDLALVTTDLAATPGSDEQGNRIERYRLGYSSGSNLTASGTSSADQLFGTARSKRSALFTSPVPGWTRRSCHTLVDPSVQRLLQTTRCTRMPLRGTSSSGRRYGAPGGMLVGCRIRPRGRIGVCPSAASCAASSSATVPAAGSSDVGSSGNQ